MFFFLYFSDISLLVYRNRTDFCMLILYPETLLSSMISSTLFWTDYLGLSIYKFMSSIGRDSSTSFFPTWMLFISFSCLIALTRTFSTMLNRSNESGHPCLVPNIRGKAFDLLPLIMMLAVGFTHSLAHTWPYVLSHFICVQLFGTPWTVACRASLSMGFSRQEYWSGLPFPSPGYFPRNWTHISYISYIGRWVLYH